MRILQLFGSTLTLALAVSCRPSVTVVTGVAYFPTNANWQTAQYRLVIRAEGEPGKQYTNVGPKRVETILYELGQPVMTNFAKIVGADLVWKVDWDRPDAFEIMFYERTGPGARLERTNLAFALPSGGNLWQRVR